MKYVVHGNDFGPYCGENGENGQNFSKCPYPTLRRVLEADQASMGKTALLGLKASLLFKKLNEDLDIPIPGITEKLPQDSSEIHEITLELLANYPSTYYFHLLLDSYKQPTDLYIR